MRILLKSAHTDDLDLSTLFNKISRLFVLLLLIPTSTFDNLQDSFISEKTKQTVLQSNQSENRTPTSNQPLRSRTTSIQNRILKLLKYKNLWASDKSTHPTDSSHE